MAMDLEAMRKAREEKQRGGDFYTFDEGDTVIYVCGPCREEDPLAFVEVKQHRGKGQKDRSFICLNPDSNKVLNHPALQAYLAEQGKDIEGGCPQCEELSAGTFKGTPEELKRVKASSRYFWNVIPMKYRKDGRLPWQALQPADNVVPCPTPFSVWDGIMDAIGNEGDVTNEDGAIFLRVNREGSGQMDTKYKVQPDSESLKKPVKLSKATREAIAMALAEGGPCDLYKIVANLILSRAEVATRMNGVEVEVEEDEDEKAEKAAAAKKPNGARLATRPTPGKPAAKAAAPKGKPKADPRGEPPACFKMDCAPTDDECQKCPFKEECAEACGVDVPPDFVAVKAVGKGKPKTAPEPEQEETEEEALAVEPIAAGNCEVGKFYQLPDDTVGEFKGAAKGKAFFQLEDESRVKLDVKDDVLPIGDDQETSSSGSESDGESVEAEQESATEEVEDELAEMERLLAEKKAKAAKAKSKTK